MYLSSNFCYGGLLIAPAEDFSPLYFLWANSRITWKLQQWQWIGTVVPPRYTTYKGDCLQKKSKKTQKIAFQKKIMNVYVYIDIFCDLERWKLSIT